MIKKIITLVVCLALCVSCIAVGVINQKADDADIAAAANGAIEGIAVSQDYPDSVLAYDEAKGEYYFDTEADTIVIENTSNQTYQDLYGLFNRTSSDKALVLNGGGKTIKTSIPLFKTIANTTIKNLNITGPEMTVEDTDFVTSTYPGFGVVACIAAADVKFDNVSIDIDIKYIGGKQTVESSMGALIGYGAVTELKNCTNKGNITVEVAAEKHFALAGMVGRISSAITVSNCINYGDIKATDTLAGGDLYVGGVVGQCINMSVNVTNTINVGDITSTSTVGNGYGAGIVARSGSGDIFTDCINIGNINVISNGGRAGGLTGHSSKKNITRCINIGDISFTSSSGTALVSQPVGGLIPWSNPKFSDCVNFGTITTDSTNTYIGGLCAHTSASATTTSYSIAITGERNPSWTTVIAPFTTTAGESNRLFATSINTAAYDIIEDVVNNLKTAGVAVDFEFGAIITLSDYLDPNAGEGKFISEFTHKAFNDYLEANKTTNAKLVNIDSLYMTATFPEGAGLVADGDNSVANVYLGGNLYNTTYVAKAYIKICDGAYIYSK